MRALFVAGLAVMFAATACGRHQALESPGCTQAAAMGRSLSGVSRTMLKLAAAPFGVASTGGFSFVTVGGYSGLNELQVYANNRLHPRLVRRVVLPVPGAASETLTPDRRELLVAAGSGVTVVDVRNAESGHGEAVLGSLQAVAATAQTGHLDPRSAIEVAVTPDGHYAFMSCLSATGDPRNSKPCPLTGCLSQTG